MLIITFIGVFGYQVSAVLNIMEEKLSPCSWRLSLLLGFLSVFNAFMIMFLLPVLLRYKVNDYDVLGEVNVALVYSRY